MLSKNISVVISAFNVEKYIDQAITSVLKQTHQDFEIIIVNNGSTDNTSNKIKAFSAKDIRIKCIEQKNLGEGGARNTGIKNATYDLIAFLDGDDVWAPKKLELQLSYMNSNKDLRLVSCLQATIDEEDLQTGWKLGKPLNGFVYHDVLENNCLAGGSNLLIKKSVFEKIGLFDELVLCADWELCIRICKEYLVTCVPKALVGYRRTKNNSSSNYREISYNTELILRKTFESDKSLDNAFYKSCLGGSKYIISVLCTIDKNYKTALKYLLESFKLNPYKLIKNPLLGGYAMFLVLSQLMPPQSFEFIKNEIISFLFNQQIGKKFT